MSMGLLRSQILICALLGCLYAAPAFAKTRLHTPELDCGDDIAETQSVSTFGSLLDGQPTDPNRPTISVTAARAAGVVILQPTIQIAPGRSRGLCDAVLSLQLPGVQWGDRVSLVKTGGLGWEQRWHADDGHLPTLATSLSAVFDFSQPQVGVSLNGTLIVAKTVGKVVLYGNAFVNYAKAPGSDASWTPGFILGVKAPARAEDAFVLDLVVEQNEPASLEFGYQLSAPDNFNIGPGIAVSLEGHPQVTIGLTIQRDF